MFLFRIDEEQHSCFCAIGSKIHLLDICLNCNVTSLLLNRKGMSVEFQNMCIQLFGFSFSLLFQERCSGMVCVCAPCENTCPQHLRAHDPAGSCQALCGRPRSPVFRPCMLTALDMPPRIDHMWDGATPPLAPALRVLRPLMLPCGKVFRNSFHFFLKAHRRAF